MSSFWTFKPGKSLSEQRRNITKAFAADPPRQPWHNGEHEENGGAGIWYVYVVMYNALAPRSQQFRNLGTQYRHALDEYKKHCSKKHDKGAGVDNKLVVV